MADDLPFGVTRADIDNYLAEHGVTRCPEPQYRPHLTAEESAAMRERLEEMKRLGELLNDGVRNGEHWRDTISRETRKAHQRANDSRKARVRGRYLALFKAGLNDEQCAHHLGVEPRQVRAMARKMGVDLQRSTSALTE